MVPKAGAALAVALLVLTAACGGGGSEEKPMRDGDGDSEAYQRADATLLSEDELPEGWTEVPAEERLGSLPGVPQYCGVSAEPEDVAEGRITTYDEGRALNRYVIVWTMVSTPEKAEATMTALAEHRDDCTQEDGRVGRPIDVEVGEESVGWLFDEPADTAFQALVFRRDEVVVALAAPAGTVLPDAEQRAIASAIDERLRTR